MSKIIILGSGAAPGVPSLAQGFGDCDSKNPKNYRMRSGTYMELSGVKFLIDTSPDLRMQLINANIRYLDAVFYTHTHADHLHGIDDVREVNRITNRAIELFASQNNIATIKSRFGYLLTEKSECIDPMHRASLHPNTFEYGQSFMLNTLKVTPIELLGHNIESTGYIFNDGEVVFIADFKQIPEKAFALITRTPQVLIMPLTTPKGTRFHASLEALLDYAKRLNPELTLINHMAVESDYAQVAAHCPKGVTPAYDGLTVEW